MRSIPPSRPRLLADLVEGQFDDAGVDAVVNGAHKLYGALGRLLEHEMGRGKLAAHKVGRHAAAIDERAGIELAILKVPAIDFELRAVEALALHGLAVGIGMAVLFGHRRTSGCQT